MTSRVPLVSVVIPAYNAGRSIDAALQSVFTQTFTDVEVIVVNDGSTDDTGRRVSAWGDRVDCHWQPNRGPGRARNAGLARARGRYVAFLDADGVWLPRKLQRQIAYFERHPQTGFLHGAVLVDRAPATTVLRTPDALPADVRQPLPSASFADLFHGKIAVHTQTVMAPIAVVQEAGGFGDSAEGDVDAWGLWLRIAGRHPIAFLPTAIAVSRPRVSSRSIEKAFAELRQAIEHAASGAACARHRGDARRCARDRLQQLYRELGHERFLGGQVTGAAAAYRDAMRLQATPVPAVLYGAAIATAPLAERSPAIRNVLSAIGRARQGRRRVDADNLVHDTTYRRARRWMAAAVHTLDDFVDRARHSTYRVIFEAASPMSLSVFRPVLDELRRDPRFEFWFMTADRSWDAATIFHSAGIVDRIVSPKRASRMKFDAYVNADFWNTTWLPRRTRRIHFFHGVAGKYNLDAPSNIAPVVASFDRIMFPNRDRLERYGNAGLIDADSDRAALIGYPKVDCLVDGSLDRATILASLDLDPSKPTILYAPTWSPHSSLHSIGVDVIAALGRMGLNVLVKLHDRSLDRTLRGSGGVDWRQRLEGLARHNHVRVASDADASPYLVAADVTVTDHSSVGFEFMLLDRPVVIIDCPVLVEKARIAPDKVALLRSAAVVARDPAGVAASVADQLGDVNRFSRERRAIAETLFYCAGTATSRAVQSIYELLDLPAPDRLTGSAPAIATASRVSRAPAFTHLPSKP